MEGVLQDDHLYQGLLSLQKARRTGILTVQGDDEIIAFSFREGEIVSADALNQTLEEGLGEVLAEWNLVATEDFAGLSAEHQSGGGRVVDLLVERSYLSRSQLLDTVREQTYRLCLEAMTWKSGEFRFYQGEEVAFEEGVQALSVDELCVRATEHLGSGGPLKGGVPEANAVFRRAPSFFDQGASGSRGGEDSVREAVSKDFGPEATRVFHFVDGQRSVAEVGAEADIPLFAAQHYLHRWSMEKIVEAELLSGSAVSLSAPAIEPSLPPAAPLELALPAVAELSPAAQPEVREPRPDTLPDLLRPLDSVASAPGAPGASGDVLGEVEIERLPGEPLEEEPEELPERRSEVRPRGQIGVPPWPSRLLGLGLWVAAVLILVTQPSRLVLPFPWQGGLREALLKERRAMVHHNIDQAADTYFLLYGRYPEGLEELRDLHLLAERDLSDPSGARLVFSSAAASYVVEAVGKAGLEDEASVTAAITGNFLMDPGFRPEDESSEAPLVLLD